MILQIHKILWLEQKRVVKFYGTINLGQNFRHLGTSKEMKFCSFLHQSAWRVKKIF